MLFNLEDKIGHVCAIVCVWIVLKEWQHYDGQPLTFYDPVHLNISFFLPGEMLLQYK